MGWWRTDLLGIEGMEPYEIEEVFDTASNMKEISSREIKKVPVLRGKTVINIFFESSTRTRVSFEIAEKRLSADAVNFSSSGSSVSKGESLIDTARNLEAMSPDIVVVRHACPGVPHMLAARLSCPVINAGDGAHEHPTQALLDLFTIREKLGRLEGACVGIFGDIAHSRVARSDILALKKMGARVIIGGPATMMPFEAEALGVEVVDRLEDMLPALDVLIMLRLQFERQKQALIPSPREYSVLYGLNPRRLKLAREGIIVMHPGPINRGIEIAPEVADGPCSLILDQVSNGVAVRMALLYLIAGAAAKARGEEGVGREWRVSDEERERQSADKRRGTEESGG
jgi:aspartate carbamoyltransferase catalytic subunit